MHYFQILQEQTAPEEDAPGSATDPALQPILVRKVYDCGMTSLLNLLATREGTTSEVLPNTRLHKVREGVHRVRSEEQFFNPESKISFVKVNQ